MLIAVNPGCLLKAEADLQAKGVLSKTVSRAGADSLLELHLGKATVQLRHSERRITFADIDVSSPSSARLMQAVIDAGVASPQHERRSR